MRKLISVGSAVNNTQFFFRQLSLILPFLGLCLKALEDLLSLNKLAKFLALIFDPDSCYRM